MGFRNMVPFMATIKEAWGKKISLIRNSYPVRATGPSMLPAIQTPATFLAERILDRYDELSRGDVVALRSPQKPTKKIIKRLVGLEGDTVNYIPIKSNKSSSPKKKGYKLQKVVVPKGHAWVQGDNISCSMDSREFGPVPYSLIEGRLFWRVSPGFGPFGKK